MLYCTPNDHVCHIALRIHPHPHHHCTTHHRRYHHHTHAAVTLYRYAAGFSMAQTIFRVVLAPMSVPFAWFIGFCIAGFSLFAQLAGLHALTRLVGEVIGTFVLEASGKRQCTYMPRLRWSPRFCPFTFPPLAAGFCIPPGAFRHYCTYTYKHRALGAVPLFSHGTRRVR